MWRAESFLLKSSHLNSYCCNQNILLKLAPIVRNAKKIFSAKKWNRNNA